MRGPTEPHDWAQAARDISLAQIEGASSLLPEGETTTMDRSQIILNWSGSEDGQGLADYALLLGLIVVVVAVVVAALGEDLFTFLGVVIKAVAMTWSGGGA
jgi:Flp pilus assembly pilin Flp